MAKHTPGPWQTKQILMDVEIGAETEQGHMSVAWVHIGQGAELEEVKSALTDASLIAAAPELLEAAKAALDQLPQFPGDCPYSRLRDAVAKAEGRDE